MEKERSTRQRIQRAIVSLLDTRDLNEIQVKDIVEVSGVSRSTFYRHYVSVYEAVEELEDEFINGIRDINRDYIPTKLTKNFEEPDLFILETLRYVQSRAEVFIALSGPHGDADFDRKAEAVQREFFIGKITFNRLYEDNLKFYSVFAVSGHTALIRYWLTECPEKTPEQMAVVVAKLMFSYFFT